MQSGGSQTTDRLFGIFCLDQPYGFGYSTLGAGPNAGYKFMTSVTNMATYRYALNPTLKSTCSAFPAFSQAQSGSYNQQTNPNGCILFATLLSNVINHEAGLIQNSHWSFYRAAQDNTANNVGVAGERIVGEPGLTDNQFNTRVRSILDPKTGPILTATQVEPCGGASDVTKDATCTFRGRINYPPYPPCQ
jgi:hypothetical protein